MTTPPEKPDQNSFFEKLKKWALSAWKLILPLLLYIKDVIQYYLKNYSSMMDYVKEYFPGLQLEKNIRREIRIPDDIDMDSVQHEKNLWKVTLPDCCVVSGHKTDNPRKTKEFELENYENPIVFFSITVIVSFIFSMILLNVWVLSLGVLAGMIIGYMNRKFETVEISYRKSDKFIERKFPKLRLFKNELIVKVGDRSVRQMFTQKEYESPLESSSSQIPPPFMAQGHEEESGILDSSESTEAPKSIPLHEGDESTPIIQENQSDNFSKDEFLDGSSSDRAKKNGEQ